MKWRCKGIWTAGLSITLCVLVVMGTPMVCAQESGTGEDAVSLEGLSVAQLTEIAGSVLSNTSYGDVFKKISDPINVYAGIMGDFQNQKFNEELMHKIDGIQTTLTEMKSQIAAQDRELKSAMDQVAGKVDLQSYSQMMNEVKTIDNEVQTLYGDYQTVLDSAEASTPEQNKAHAADWAAKAERANLDAKISRINALMSNAQSTDTLWAAGERVLRGGYPFEHQIRTPMYSLYQYTVGVRQQLLFLSSEYYHYQSALKGDAYYDNLYLSRYNTVITAINAEVEASKLTELADPEAIHQSMTLYNPDRGQGKTVAGYGVILNANRKTYFIAQGADTLSELYTYTSRHLSGRYPYEHTYCHNENYPVQDATGQFKLIDSQGDLYPLAEAAWGQKKGARFLDWLVDNGGLADLSGCQVLLTSDCVENLPGPIMYTDTKTKNGRQKVFDANQVTYNELGVDVVDQSYIANYIRASESYNFGGAAEATPWHAARLLLVLEKGGDGPVTDLDFVPKSLDDFPGEEPVLGLPFGRTLTVDLSQMTQTDFQGKTLHLEGKVVLDGGEVPRSFTGVSLEMGTGAEVTLKNLEITGRDNVPVLKAKGGSQSLTVAGQVTLTAGGGTQSRPGIQVENTSNQDTLTILSGNADGSPGQLTVQAAGEAPGIQNGFGTLKIAGIMLSARGSGDCAGIYAGGHLAMEDTTVTAVAGSAKASDIGMNYFTKERSSQAYHKISNCTLTLGYNQISGDIQMMPDCRYTNGVPYYITFTHGGSSEDWDEDSEYTQPLTLIVTGTGGERRFEADCSIASGDDPEVMVLEDGDLSDVNLGTLGTLEIETFTDSYGPYPQSLRVAMGSPYGVGDENGRFDCYRELSASDEEQNTFHMDDRVVRLSLWGNFSPSVMSGLQAALADRNQAPLTEDIPWMDLSGCYQDNQGSYYLNLGNALNAPEILWLKRQDRDQSDGAKLTEYYLMSLKKTIGGFPQTTANRQMNQWLPLKGVSYPIFLRDEPVNSFGVTLALENQRVLADDLILEVEGSEGTQRIALKKFLPEGTWLSGTPTHFNVLFDQGMGHLKRARLLKGEGEAKDVVLSIAHWDFYYNQTGSSTSYPPTFSLGPCVMHQDEWHSFKALNLGGVTEKPRPEEPGISIGSNTMDTPSKLKAQNPGTGYTPVQKGTAEIYFGVLVILGIAVLLGRRLLQK
ncbi:hypothetical protein [Eubacterium sp.]|uniref:hypothetical protein n=1 Tax=Eubacterium sp. TaxID=142586 RepID=UPI002FC67BA6